MIHHGDCLEVMPTLPAESVDSIVTDPPYGLSFMGKNWDHGIPGEPFWREALRIAKPGTHLLAFGGTRTFHRLTCAIEDAGWEIRDCIMWVYGSGFPKSHDVSKAIDREAGYLSARGKGFNAAGEGGRTNGGDKFRSDHINYVPYAPATPAAQQWQGWGTALKPAWEPIIVARKPLAGTVAQNVQEYGTGAVNVDGCRVGSNAGWSYPNGRGGSEPHHMERGERNGIHAKPCEATAGRWPANLIHDGSDEVTGLMGEAARFFMKCNYDEFELNLCRAKAIIHAWNIDLANIAECSSSLSKQYVDSVLSRAVIAATLGGKLLKGVTGLSTNVTAKELETICETLIATILIIEGSVSQEPLQGVRIQNGSLVRSAEKNERTGITTITISLQKSDGFAVNVTFSITSKSKGVGDRDCPARIRYCAKASKADRDEGNRHPTVKPTALMRYLCRLVTPPGGIVFDPFCGSGSTGKAATLEGFRFIGIEREAEYVEIAKARIAHARGEMPLLEAVS